MDLSVVQGIFFFMLARPLALFVAMLPVAAMIWLAAGAAGLKRENSFLALLAGTFFLMTCSLFFLVFSYFEFPSFLDHIEPNTAIVAALFNQGLPIYHAVDSAERYSFLYGPLTYIANGLMLDLAGESVQAFKLTGIVCLCFSFLFTGLASREVTHRKVLAVLTALGYLAVLSLLFKNYSFWSKPDSLMMAFAAIGLWSCTLRSPVLGYLICGVALGAIVNTKLHGVLYLLPFVAWHFSSSGFRTVFLIGAVSLVVAALPFLLFPNISFLNYVTLLQGAGAHGISPELLVQNSIYLLFLLLPYGLIALQRASRAEAIEWLRTNALVILSSSVAVVLVLVAGSKPGSGPHHFLPFAPALAWLFSYALNTSVRAESKSGLLAVPLGAYLLALSMKALVTLYFLLGITLETAASERILADVRDIQQQYPERKI